MRAVRIHPDFDRDHATQLRWLVAHDEPTWITNLSEGIRGAIGLLRRFPEAGTRVTTKGPFVLRKLILRRGPYVIWYAYDLGDPSGDLWLVRLFHARQRRPRPDPSRWFETS